MQQGLVREADPHPKVPVVLWRPQVQWLRDERGQVLVKEIVRFETLEADWARVSEKVFGRHLRLPHCKVLGGRKRPDYKQAYSESGRRLVAELCAEDLEYFKYTF